jgi:ribosomal protein S1
VVQKAVKTDEEGQYAFGVFVDIGDGLNGLVHVSELTGIQSQQRTRLNSLEEGDNISVKVLSKEMVAGKPRIRLSEKSAAVETLLSDHKPGSKVYGTVKKLISLGNKHGLFIDLNGVPGFLPEEDANVAKLESLTKNKNQRVHVTITDESIEGHVRVTRK